MFGNSKSNLWLDLIILLSFLTTALTGFTLWLILPEGRGSGSFVFLGLNKHTWTDIHNWAGLIMLAGAILHLLLHWKWIVNVAQRYFCRLARQARLYFTLDIFLFLVFVLVNISGLIAWLAFGEGGYQGGRNPFYNLTIFGLGRHDWNDLHLWAGLVIVAILVVHVFLHWKWLLITTRRYLQTLIRNSQYRDVSEGYQV